MQKLRTASKYRTHASPKKRRRHTTHKRKVAKTTKQLRHTRKTEMDKKAQTTLLSANYFNSATGPSVKSLSSPVQHNLCAEERWFQPTDITVV